MTIARHLSSRMNPDTLKPASEFRHPPVPTALQNEAKLVVMPGIGGRDIPVDRALHPVFGCAIALDMSRRDLQAVQGTTGYPLDIGKAFEGSAPVGRFIQFPRSTQS